MSKVKIELNRAGVRDLLQSTDMQSLLREHAEAIAGRAGEGYGADSVVLSTRAVASAYTETFEAMRDSMKNNTLLKAVKG